DREVRPRGAQAGAVQRIQDLTGRQAKFTTRVLAAIRRIPAGKVATYGDVAKAAGFPRAARGVATALRGTGSIGIPWQRVLGSGGKILLTGQNGYEQRLRLEAEGVQFRGGRVDLSKHRFRFR